MPHKNCLVLDDEQHSIDILSEYIEKTPGLTLLSALKDPIEAIPLIQTEQIDIAFIDVQMPNLTGIQFLKLLPKSTKVVLCTAYSEYAIDAFDLNVIDYLLKPISFERFIRCIQKIDGSSKELDVEKKRDAEEEYIFVKSDAKGKFMKIYIKDILFIEGLGNYQKIKTIDNQIVCLLKLKNLEDQLTAFGFIRVHKSFIVPLHKITQIEGNKILIGDYNIPIGDSFKDVLFEKIRGKILL